MVDPTKNVFSRNSADEADRVPENGGTPRVSDTLVGSRDSPDPVYHPESRANALTDTEPDSMPDDEMDEITPLKRRP